MIANKYIFALIIFIVGVVYVVPNFKPAGAVSGSNFNPERIIDLGVFTNRNSMSVSQIQAFLNSKVPNCDTNGDRTYRGVLRRNYSSSNPAPFTCLKDFYQNTSTGASNYGGAPIPSGAKSAARIIWEAGQAHNINPQVLLVTLQKETSLVADDWPWEGQYERAMGYGCPDSGPNFSANCDSQYYGFYNQINLAAQQFRRYLNFPENYNYTVGDNYVLYNPNPACGGSNLNIVTSATAALYNYTPYQPNQASIDNYPGEAPCGAYGNRNFWFKYNEWFGTTLDDVRRVRANTGDLTQFVLYDGKKQGIPSSQVLRAWGIDKLPLETLPRETIDSIPNHTTNLQQKATNYDNGKKYLAEDDKHYLLKSSTDAAWGFTNSTAEVGQELLSITSYAGRASVFATPTDSNTVFLVNGSKIHPFGNYDAYKALDRNEPPLVISSQLLNDFVLSEAINHNFVTFDTSTVKLIDNGKVRRIPLELQNEYFDPNTTTPTSLIPEIEQFFATDSRASRFIRKNGAIHLIANAGAYGLPNQSIYIAYKNGSDPYNGVTNLGSNAFNLLEKKPTLRTQLVKDELDNYFYLDTSQNLARPIASEVQQSLGGSFLDNALLVDSDYINYFSTQSNFSRFIKSYSGGAVFMLDNGVRRGISSLSYLRNIIPEGQEITRINNKDLSNIPKTDNLTSIWQNSDQTSTYIVDDGVLRPILNSALDRWTDDYRTVAVSDETISFFALGAAIDNGQISNSNQYYLISDGSLLLIPGDYHNDWGLNANLSYDVSSDLIDTLNVKQVSSNYVSNNGSILLMNNNELYGFKSLDSLFNSGYSGQRITEISNSLKQSYSNIPANGFLAVVGSEVFALERGVLRPLSPVDEPDWTDNGVLLDTSISLSLKNESGLRYGSQIKNSLSSIDSNTVYAVKNGTKAPIANYQLFVNSYRPEETVSKYLLRTMTLGPELR